MEKVLSLHLIKCLWNEEAPLYTKILYSHWYEYVYDNNWEEVINLSSTKKHDLKLTNFLCILTGLKESLNLNSVSLMGKWRELSRRGSLLE